MWCGLSSALCELAHPILVEKMSVCVCFVWYQGVHQLVARVLGSGLFQLVVYPPLDVAQMTKRKNRISHRVSRLMRHLHHGQLVVRLRRVCRMHSVCLLEGEEAYTTAACNWCGLIATMVGASKVHVCRDGGCAGRHGSDRDGGAARNILFKVPHVCFLDTLLFQYPLRKVHLCVVCFTVFSHGERNLCLLNRPCFGTVPTFS